GVADPSGALARTVWEQTRGWPAGVRGASLGLAALPETSRHDVAISDEIFNAINDFLVQEVFHLQPEVVREALMRLALVERFDGELAEILTAADDAGSPGKLMLTELLAASPYLERDTKSGWSRFHPLYRRFLLEQLTTHHARRDRQAIQRRVGQALADRGEIDDAIRLLADAGDLDAAADLIEEQIGAALARQDWHRVDRWIRLLPPAMIPLRPWLLVGRMWVSHLSGRDSLLAAYTRQVRVLAEDGHPDAEALQATCDLFAAVGAADPPGALSLVQRAMQTLPHHHAFAQGLAQFHLGLTLQALGRSAEALDGLIQWTDLSAEQIDARFVLGLQGQMWVQHAEGHLVAADSIAAELSTLARQHDLPVAFAWAERERGIVAYLQDRLEDAAGHFNAVIAEAGRANIACVADSLTGLVCTLWAQGKREDALAALDRTLETTRDQQVAEHWRWVQATSALLALRDTPPDTTRALGLTAGVSPDATYLIQFAYAPRVRIEALLHSSTPEHLHEARMRLAALEKRAGQQRNVPMQIQAATLRAALQESLGDHAEALATLRAAIHRAAPDRMFRPFIDHAPLLRPLLLELLAQRHEDTALAALADALGPAFRVELPVGVSPSLKLLTIREAEVFDLLMERLTYKEIAYQLSISPDTVKRHVNSIYTKLDVTSRREALLKASELGWQSP
ncbi:MAG: hypothetical protein KC442_19815, partial [Thermomicrobiales bacterium]|nr:hypothetical protein [Thermomicrobiales bacterium]